MPAFTFEKISPPVRLAPAATPPKKPRGLISQMIDRIAACAALRRNDWHDRHRFVAEVFDLPLAPETTRKLDFQIEVLMARVAQLEGGLSAVQPEGSGAPSASPIDERLRTE